MRNPGARGKDDGYENGEGRKVRTAGGALGGGDGVADVVIDDGLIQADALDEHELHVLLLTTRADELPARAGEVRGVVDTDLEKWDKMSPDRGASGRGGGNAPCRPRGATQSYRRAPRWPCAGEPCWGRESATRRDHMGQEDSRE